MMCIFMRINLWIALLVCLKAAIPNILSIKLYCYTKILPDCAGMCRVAQQQQKGLLLLISSSHLLLTQSTRQV